MGFFRAFLAAVVTIGFHQASADTVIVNVTGAVDFVDSSASGISVGDPISGAIVYDDEFVFAPGPSDYYLGPKGYPGSLMLRVGGLVFTEEDDSLFGQDFELFPTLRFLDGELVGINFATGGLGGAFGINTPEIQLSTIGPDGAGDRFSFGFDRDFDGHNEDERVAGQLVLIETIAEVGAGLREINNLIATPHGERSSDSDYRGELGPLLDEIIDKLLADPGEAIRPAQP